MLHENLQGDVIGEDGCASVTAVVEHVVVRLRGIHFRQQEPRLRSASLGDDIARHGESGLKDLLSVVDGSLEQLSEVLILGLILVIELLPSRYRLAVVDDDVKEGVHQKNSVVLQRRSVQQNRLRWSIEGVGVEDRLDHDQGLSQILFRQAMPIVGSFIGTVVEDLQKLRSSEMEHKLRVEGEVLGEPEGGRIFWPELAEFLAEFDQHSVRPPQHVGRLLALSAEHRQSRHQRSSAFLVESHFDMLDVSRRIGPVSGEGGDANFSEAGGVLIMSDELDASSASLRNRSLVLIDDFEEKGQSRCVVEPA